MVVRSVLIFACSRTPCALRLICVDTFTAKDSDSAYNRPRSIYQYSNMALRLSGQTSIFGVVFFVWKSLLGIERQKKFLKFAIFTRKPRIHDRILIYRTRPINVDFHGSASSSIPRSFHCWFSVTGACLPFRRGLVARFPVDAKPWEQSPSRSWLPIVLARGCLRHPSSI